MALQFVGGNSNTGAGGTDITVDLTSLTGGVDTAARTGDYVIAIFNYSGNNLGSANIPTISTSGYTTLASLFSDDSDETNLKVGGKFMGTTADTSVTAGVSADATGFVGAVYVWRNVNATPMDVTQTTATGIDSCVINSPSITPTTTGAYVLSIGGNVSGANNKTPTAAPSGYSNFLAVGVTASNNFAGIGAASKAWTTGAEDPGTFTTPSANSSDSWAAVTIALRPFIASGPANLKTYNTNLKANIKSINTNLIANCKSLNTNV